MTQLDLPQISFARYLDLLKRRSWQVIPVSLLGLLVGGVVAFFIPRYFVAETTIEYHQKPGETDKDPLGDPLAEEVDALRQTMPQAIGETVKQLGWEDAAIDDPYLTQQYENGLWKRVEVTDLTAARPGRKYAHLRITYSDRDGARSADFLNALVHTWIERQLQELRSQATRILAGANEEANTARLTFEAANHDLRDVTTRHNIWATANEEALRDERKQAESDLKALAKAVADARNAVAEAETALQVLRSKRDALPPKVPASSLRQASDLPKNLDPMQQAKVQQYLYAIAVLEIAGTAHPDRAGYELDVIRLAKEMQLVGVGVGVGVGDVENPALAKLRQELIPDQEQKLQRLQADAKAAQQELEELQTKLGKLPAAHDEYRDKLERFDSARTQKKAAQEKVQRASDVLARLSNEIPIQQIKRAVRPPKPTDPNIFLVAAVGCAAGLGVAIGLILLFDMLRGTFKTVDDVERGLPLPVLGSLSHLETIEQRQQVVSGRRRASLLVGSLLVLVLVLVTVYELDPTRLPPFARDLLALLLGGG